MYTSIGIIGRVVNHQIHLLDHAAFIPVFERESITHENREGEKGGDVHTGKQAQIPSPARQTLH